MTDSGLGFSKHQCWLFHKFMWFEHMLYVLLEGDRPKNKQTNTNKQTNNKERKNFFSSGDQFKLGPQACQASTVPLSYIPALENFLIEIKK
jgi:hypothetical protein